MLPAEAHDGVWVIKDISSSQELIGCGNCLDHKQCGGLHLPNGTAMLTCMDLCRCPDQNECDLVCPKAPSRFTRRVHEVSGFSLDNIPHRGPLNLPKLPNVAPILEGRMSQRRPVEIDYAAIPLSRAVTGKGMAQRAKTAQELKLNHGVAPRKGWLLTGIEDDRYVERSWRLPKPKETFKALAQAGVIFATSPNYSLYADVPRHDNLHAVKRIAWTWYQMNEAGLPTALHVNARTDHDFDVWAQFVAARPEVTSIAFEFLTGAKPREDATRYIDRLTRLRQLVGRNLLLVVRGAAEYAKELEETYEQVLWLDAGPYFKAVHRQEPSMTSGHVPKYHTMQWDAPVGALFKRLATASELRYNNYRVTAIPSPQASLDLRPAESPLQVGTDDTPNQGDLFAEGPLAT